MNVKWDMAVLIILSTTMIIVCILSIINFYRKPPLSIFASFEENMRNSLNKYIVTLNLIYAKNGINLKGGGGLRFEISHN